MNQVATEPIITEQPIESPREPTNESPQDQQGENQSTPVPTKSDDLLSRVTAFQKDNAPKDPSQSDSQSDQPDNLEATIANIEDPTIKAQFEKLRKDLVSGTNTKFQEIATLRKEMQTNMEQFKKVGQPEEWTAERVQQLANDPKFIAAAQQVSGIQPESDEYSALSDGEKKAMTDMRSQLEDLKRVNQQSLIAQEQQVRAQQHAEYSSKYENYNPQKIDEITFNLQKGSIHATNEHIYKAFYHDDNVRNAYEMGRQDEREGISDKIDSATVGGITTQQSTPSVTPEENESSKSFFDRIISSNISKLNKK